MPMPMVLLVVVLLGCWVDSMTEKEKEKEKEMSKASTHNAAANQHLPFTNSELAGRQLEHMGTCI